MRATLLALSGIGILAVLVSACAAPGAPKPAATETASLSPENSAAPATTVSPSMSPSSTPIQPVEVLASVALPHPGPQSAPAEAVAVLGHTLWILDASQDFLVQIDLVGDRVVSTVPVPPSAIAAGDGRVLTISPVGLAGSAPPPLTLDRVDPATGTLRLVRDDLDAPPNIAVGLGSAWLAGNDTLVRVDPMTGQILADRSIPGALAAAVACGKLWIQALGPGGASLDQIDPGTGRIIWQTAVPEGTLAPQAAAGACWLLEGDGRIAKLEPGAGIVNRTPPIGMTVQVAGDAFWETTWDGQLRKVDPTSGQPGGPTWQLPKADLPSNPKFADWRLIGLDGDTWLLDATGVVKLGFGSAG